MSESEKVAYLRGGQCLDSVPHLEERHSFHSTIPWRGEPIEFTAGELPDSTTVQDTYQELRQHADSDSEESYASLLKGMSDIGSVGSGGSDADIAQEAARGCRTAASAAARFGSANNQRKRKRKSVSVPCSYSLRSESRRAQSAATDEVPTPFSLQPYSRRGAKGSLYSLQGESFSAESGSSFLQPFNGNAVVQSGEIKQIIAAIEKESTTTSELFHACGSLSSFLHKKSASTLKQKILHAREILDAGGLEAVAAAVQSLEACVLGQINGRLTDDNRPLTLAGAALNSLLKISNDLHFLILQYKAFDSSSRMHAWIQRDADICVVRLLGSASLPSILIEGLTCVASNLMIANENFRKRLLRANLIGALSGAMLRPKLQTRATFEIAYCFRLALWASEEDALSAEFLLVIKDACPALAILIAHSTIQKARIWGLQAIYLSCRSCVEMNSYSRSFLGIKSLPVHPEKKDCDLTKKWMLHQYRDAFIKPELIVGISSCLKVENITNKSENITSLVKNAIQVLHILLIGMCAKADPNWKEKMYEVFKQEEVAMDLMLIMQRTTLRNTFARKYLSKSSNKTYLEGILEMILFLCTIPCEEMGSEYSTRPISLGTASGPAFVDMLAHCFVQKGKSSSNDVPSGDLVMKPYTLKLCAEIMSRVTLFGDQYGLFCSYCGTDVIHFCGAKEKVDACPGVNRSYFLGILLSIERSERSFMDCDSSASTVTTITTTSSSNNDSIVRADVLKKISLRVKQTYAVLPRFNAKATRMHPFFAFLIETDVVGMIIQCTRSRYSSSVGWALTIIHHVSEVVGLPDFDIFKSSFINSLLLSNGAQLLADVLLDAVQQRLRLSEEELLVLLQVISFILLHNPPFNAARQSEQAVHCWNIISNALLTALDQFLVDCRCTRAVGWKVSEVLLEMILIVETLTTSTSEPSPRNNSACELHLEFCIEQLHLLSALKTIIFFSSIDADASQLLSVQRLMKAAINVLNRNGFSAAVAQMID